LKSGASPVAEPALFGYLIQQNADSSITHLASKEKVECFPPFFNLYLKVITGKNIKLLDCWIEEEDYE
jgi:hypothetical protein